MNNTNSLLFKHNPISEFLFAMHSTPQQVADAYGIDDEQERKELEKQLALVRKWANNATGGQFKKKRKNRR